MLVKYICNVVDFSKYTLLLIRNLTRRFLVLILRATQFGGKKNNTIPILMRVKIYYFFHPELSWGLYMIN